MGQIPSSYLLTAIATSTGLKYHVEVSGNAIVNNATAMFNANSSEANVTIDPELNITTSYYPQVINITSPHSFAVNALYNAQITGGTGNYIYVWDTSSLNENSLSYNAFVIDSSCHSNSPFCEITAANVTNSTSGTLSVSIYDTSDGNVSSSNTQYYFVTANPDPPLASDYLDRNVSTLPKQRIGIITPGAGQIIYALGLGSDVVAVTAAVGRTLPSFGISVAGTVANIGLDYDYYLPDYFEELVNTTANYVPIDGGAFEGTLTAGTAAFQAGKMTAPVLGGGFDRNISGVENDVLVVANTTGTMARGLSVVSGMKKVLSNVQDRISGSSRSSAAMIIWYGYGSMYVDGNESFIGSEMDSVNSRNIFSGYYPAPSPEQLILLNPEYIIASIFGTPYSNISTTYQQLSSIPGIKNTTAWKEGHIYVLGDLATNITDEPGPLAAYGTLLYAIILHPQQFGYNQTTLPNNITDQWVQQNIMPSLNFAPPAQDSAGQQAQSTGGRPASSSTTTPTSSTTASTSTRTTTSNTTTAQAATSALTTSVISTTTVAPIATTVPQAQQHAASPYTNSSIVSMIAAGVAIAAAIAASVAYSRRRG